MNYLALTRDFHVLPLLDRLKDDGKIVVVGMVQEEEDPSVSAAKTESRLSLYDGILEKQSADDVLAWMKDLPDKDDWFCLFDYGDLWPYAEKALAMGFTKGIFPTEEHYELEKDRQKGKAFAKKYYPKLKIAPVHDFKTVQEAIVFLHKEQQKIFVLKSEGSNAETVVPATNDFDLARRQIIGALMTEKKGYERGGFTLEERIRNPIELTPVMIFWNGKPLFSLVELENKPLGSGNIGRLTGGCQNLTIQTRLNAKINSIAFPPIVYEMAKKQPGLSVFDAGLLYDGKSFYFTEWCGMRFGFPGLYAEIAMCGEDEKGRHSALRHFEMIAQGQNPLRYRYGAAVRLFQTEPSGKHGDLYEAGYEIDWLNEVSDQLFLYCIERKKVEDSEENVFVSTSYEKDLGEATGAGQTANDAIVNAYKAATGIAMTGLLYRPQFDFLSTAYPSSIANRWKFLQGSGWL